MFTGCRDDRRRVYDLSMRTTSAAGDRLVLVTTLAALAALGSTSVVATPAHAVEKTYFIDDVSVVEGNTGSTNAVFTVTRTGKADGRAGVDFITSPGTATEGVDYTATSGTLVFDKGVTKRTIQVPIFGDTSTESNETFSVLLSKAIGGEIGDGVGQATIVDDDTPTILRHTVTYGASPTLGGGVTVSGGGCSTSGCRVDEGTALTFTYAANSGYRFAGWTGSCVVGAGNSSTATANADVTCTANFVAVYTLSVSASPANGGLVSISGAGCSGTSCTVEAGTTLTIDAKQNPNWRFTGWTGCIASPSSSASVIVNATKSCTAHFYSLWAVSHHLSATDVGTAAIALEDGSIAFDGRSADDGLVLRLDERSGDRAFPDTVLSDERGRSSFVVDAIPIGDASHAALMSDGAGTEHPALVIFDKSQRVVFRREYLPDGDLFADVAPARLIRTSDGGFLIVATANSKTHQLPMVYLIKLDPHGAWQWSRAWLASDDDARYATQGRSVVEVVGGYVVVGSVDRGEGTPRYSTAVSFVDLSGNLRYSRLIHLERNNEPYDVTTGLFGELIVTGAEEEASGEVPSFCSSIPCDALVLALDPSTGTPIFAKSLGRAGFTDSLRRVVTLDDRYAAIGTTRVDDGRGNDVWFATLDEKGVPIDQSAFGGAGNEIGLGVAALGTGGFAVTGATTSWTDGVDLWALRLDETGMLDGFDAAANASIDRPAYAPVNESSDSVLISSVAIATGMAEADPSLTAREVSTIQQRQAP